MRFEDWPTCPTIGCDNRVCLWAGTGKCAPCSEQEIGDEETKELHTLALAPARAARYVRMYGTGKSVEGPSYLLQEMLVFRSGGMRSQLSGNRK